MAQVENYGSWQPRHYRITLELNGMIERSESMSGAGEAGANLSDELGVNDWSDYADRNSNGIQGSRQAMAN